MKKIISFIFGTRPEAIKLCPLIKKIEEIEIFEPHVCVTGQHRHMLDQVLGIFNVKPHVDLNLMHQKQTLADLSARAIFAIDKYLGDDRPDLVIVQGDTTTAFCAALCAFYHKIPVAHVEAGLRTWNNRSPFPEEMNRVLTSRLADIHFAPTQRSKNNLLKEGVSPEHVFVTGNTVIDALFMTVDRVKKDPPIIKDLPNDLQPGTLQTKPKLILITGHRRENFGQGFENICNAIGQLAKIFHDFHFVYPVHLNPNVREPVNRILKNSLNHNVHLIEPLDYYSFIGMMSRSFIILTDSGGVQEEAPSLGKPVLVMRDTTERPEALEMGTVKLVGTDSKAIVNEVSKLIKDTAEYSKMINTVNPYGDGKSCERIIEVLQSHTIR